MKLRKGEENMYLTSGNTTAWPLINTESVSKCVSVYQKSKVFNYGDSLVHF